MENNNKPRYRIIWPSPIKEVRQNCTHILAPVFNGGLECTLAWYYFNNEKCVKIL